MWSRRIDKKHRLLYQIIEETVTVFVIAAKGILKTSSLRSN
ncbi:MAG: hypothetical protein ABIN80_05195 [Dyadobacter sp.]